MDIAGTTPVAPTSRTAPCTSRRPGAGRDAVRGTGHELRYPPGLDLRHRTGVGLPNLHPPDERRCRRNRLCRKGSDRRSSTSAMAPPAATAGSPGRTSSSRSAIPRCPASKYGRRGCARRRARCRSSARAQSPPSPRRDRSTNPALYRQRAGRSTCGGHRRRYRRRGAAFAAHSLSNTSTKRQPYC